jgi:D-alanyl-D-alanine carboxypeptidase (penicillin-binding protein 5/6)
LVVSIALVTALALTLGYGAWLLHVAYAAGQPVAVASAYCAALQHKTYRSAYRLLAPDAQQRMTFDTFVLTAQLQDQIDGPVARCVAPQPGLGAAFSFDVRSSRTSVGMQIARTRLFGGAMTLARVGADWRVEGLAQSLAGTDVGPLVVESQFCAGLRAKDYATASREMADALRAQVADAAIGPMFGNSDATALASCQPDLSSYKVAAKDDAAEVRASFVVKPIGGTNAQVQLAVPVLLTFAHATTWSVGGAQLAPTGIASATASAAPGEPHVPSSAPQPPYIGAAAAMLLDPTTNAVYLARNADQERAMASTTKIMTAVVALTVGQLNQQITVGPDATALDNGIASVAGLQLGDKLTLHDLLYALLLPSGDDAAVAIAEGVAGSQPAFVGLMNMEAGLLGLQHTHYSNVHGLDAPNHHTTARDLAVLTEFALRNAAFSQIVGTATWQVVANADHGAYSWATTNLLLTSRQYPGATGVKTGYTGNAGACLVFAATRGPHQLLGVVLGEPDELERFGDAAALLSWGWGLEVQQ